MEEKLFISYNHNDKTLVDTIVRRLDLEFGRNNIFYDQWSMQPGDSIVGKMDKGLTEFTTFFFFISPNSLASKMVTLEWQTALNRAINGDLKFVAVRIAECSVPTIISNIQNIDLYGEGLDNAVQKMKCVVKCENNYKPLEEVSNIKVSVQTISRTVTTGSDVITTQVGCVLNASTVQLHRPLKPGFPFVFEVTLKNNAKHFNDVTFFKLIDAEKRMYQYIPFTNIELLENTVK